jgi:acyl carrier protein
VNDLAQEIRLKIAEVAGTDVVEIGQTATLEGLGLDSSDAVILAMEVEELIGREVDVGVFLRCETIGEAIGEVLRLVESK